MDNKKLLTGACLAELIGTFFLVFFGVGSVFVAALTGALQGLFQVAIVWGLVIALGIYATSIISGILNEYERAEGIVRGQAGSEKSAMVFGEYFRIPAASARTQRPTQRSAISRPWPPRRSAPPSWSSSSSP